MLQTADTHAKHGAKQRATAETQQAKKKQSARRHKCNGAASFQQNSLSRKMSRRKRDILPMTRAPFAARIIAAKFIAAKFIAAKFVMAKISNKENLCNA
ncbi:MAG: hypothetical protein DCC52_17535 [Chloroflexi bacterium]|nr:MAG: hypothetical protein DCC52_17535 [Chloroflexota bacterium]